MPPLPPVTQALILINVAIFCLQSIVPGLDTQFALWPIGSPRFMPWQVVSYAFIHGGLMHLFFNMWGIWMFGGTVESALGRKRYLQLYATSLLVAAAVQLIVAPLLGTQSAIIGASGALFGLLVAFAMIDPDRELLMIIPPVRVKARTLALIYGALELYVMLPAFLPGVGFLNYLLGNAAHLAHLGGMLGGFLLMRYWQRPRKRR